MTEHERLETETLANDHREDLERVRRKFEVHQGLEEGEGSGQHTDVTPVRTELVQLRLANGWK